MFLSIVKLGIALFGMWHKLHQAVTKSVVFPTYIFVENVSFATQITVLFLWKLQMKCL